MTTVPSRLAHKGIWLDLAVCVSIAAAAHLVAVTFDLAAGLRVWASALDWQNVDQLPFALLALAIAATLVARRRRGQYARELAAREMAENRADYLARHDALTGLPNRALFSVVLEDRIARSHGTDDKVALVLVDLDRFKDVNDTLGHGAGDALLIEAGRRLRGCVREHDAVARLDGDEFALILGGVHRRADVGAVAERIVGAFAAPFAVSGEEVPIEVSIGVAIFPLDGSAVDELLSHADLALAKAKENGRSGYQCFAADMKYRIEQRLRLEQELRAALQRSEFELHYQPIVDLADLRVIGAEALLRWHHPRHGLVAPDDFLPVAEASGLIVPLAEWVLHAACAQARAWQTLDEVPPLRIAVNLAAAQFQDQDLVGFVESALQCHGLEPRALELEITENIIIGATGAPVVQALERLHRLGVQLALDDFGTGYSSLSHLTQIPIERVKIDRSFVRDMLSDPDDAAIVRAVITLGRSLGLSVVAEGIETAEQLEALRAEGCPEGQGYLFSRPKPAAEVTELLRAPAELPALRLVS